jgi:uncharacterized protein
LVLWAERLLFALLASSEANHALAQNAGDMFNMFGAIMRAAIIDHARMEWSKISPNEASCLEEALGKQGYSISAMIENGVAPGDPRVSGLRFGCRTSTATLSPPTASAEDVLNLSSKPTFDCARGRSLTAQVICLDQAGASADWDLTSAYWARYFSIPEDSRRAFEQAQERWLDTLNQTCRRSQDQRGCVLSAYRNRAAGYRNQLTGDALAESRLSPEQHGQIQLSLISKGLLDDKADGEFGVNTRAGIRRFQAESGAVESDYLTPQQREQLLGDNLPNAAGKTVSTCFVKDPTGTPLNVRTAPNGPVVDTLANGTQVRIVSTQPGDRGRAWSQIERPGGNRPLGWVYGEYIECAAVTQTPTAPSPQPNPPLPPKPPSDTPRLNDARIFLEDAKKFIAAQNSVPSISAIAQEAASLQIAIGKFDETEALKARQRLADLLQPLPGFEEFEQQQQAARTHEEALQLAAAQTEGNVNIAFIDNYMRVHLGDSKTAALTNFKDQIDKALKSNAIEQISRANNALRSYVDNNGLSDLYQESRTKKPNPTSSVAERLGVKDKSIFVIQGSDDDIVLLYNASRTAPSVWQDVQGKIEFENDSASFCFGETSPDIKMVRYIEQTLHDKGAKSLTSTIAPCDLARVPSSIDIIAFRRGDFLSGQDDYSLAIVKLIESDTFRKYQVVIDYPLVLQRRQALSRQIEHDVEAGERKGFGAIAVADSSPVACIIAPENNQQIDGIKELLNLKRGLIAPNLSAEWQFEDTNTDDHAFLNLQRQQCGYVAGRASDLQAILVALRRANLSYSFPAVWWSEQDVDQATANAAGNTQGPCDNLILEGIRNNDIQNQLRAKYGVKARGLANRIHELVKTLAERRDGNAEGIFSDYKNWLDVRFAEQWETTNVDTEIEDFGTVQWEHRGLDAIVVKSKIRLKNAVLGRYADQCFMFGLIDDSEFNRWRDPLAVDCHDKKFVNDWGIRKSFQSEWNVPASTTASRPQHCQPDSPERPIKFLGLPSIQ